MFAGNRLSIKERLFSRQKISGQAPLESDGCKSKTISMETRRDEAAAKRQDLCTTEPRSHGENQKIRWARVGPPGFHSVQGQGFDISISPLQQEVECTELQFTQCEVAFPWPRFSDNRIYVR